MRAGRGPRTWFVAGTVAFPVVVLAHEFGHYLAAVALGFRDVRIHYMSVSGPELEILWTQLKTGGATVDEAGIDWRAVAPILSGVAVTYLTIVMSCVVVARRHARPLVVWLGLAAPLRFYFSAGSVLAWMGGHSLPLTAEDESRLAAVFGVHPGALVGFGVVTSFAASSWILRRTGERTGVVASSRRTRCGNHPVRWLRRSPPAAVVSPPTDIPPENQTSKAQEQQQDQKRETENRGGDGEHRDEVAREPGQPVLTAATPRSGNEGSEDHECGEE
jgi:hypothetical protein